jgi:hypothetical protein
LRQEATNRDLDVGGSSRLMTSALTDVSPLGRTVTRWWAGSSHSWCFAAAGMPGWQAARVDALVALRDE